jgi:hypothetical protein
MKTLSSLRGSSSNFSFFEGKLSENEASASTTLIEATDDAIYEALPENHIRLLRLSTTT